MAFTEDMTPFFTDFGDAATLGGAAVRVIFDGPGGQFLGGKGAEFLRTGRRRQLRGRRRGAPECRGDRPDGDGTAVARGRLVGGAAPRMEAVQVLWRMTPTIESGMHYGSRLAFSPDGFLFITTGERSILPGRAQAQDLAGVEDVVEGRRLVAEHHVVAAGDGGPLDYAAA